MRVRIADSINRLHRTHRIFPMQQLRQRNHLTFRVTVGLAGPHMILDIDGYIPWVSMCDDSFGYNGHGQYVLIFSKVGYVSERVSMGSIYYY